MKQSSHGAQTKLICHIIYKLDYGGLENGLVNLINWMPSNRYRHSILCLTEATDFRNRLLRSDVEILEAHKRPGKDPGAYIRVLRLLRRLRPSVVHTRNIPTIDMLLPAWLAGVRQLVHGEHGLDVIELDGKNRKYNLLRRLSRSVVNRYIAVSADLASWLDTEIGVPNHKISLIYNGVDIDRFRPRHEAFRTLPQGFAPENPFVIGTIGRLEKVKDQETLVRAFAQIIADKPELGRKLRLLIVGDGSQRARIESVLTELGVRDLAWLTGLRDDIPELYRSMDVFVLPSRREGISNTALEAMASGLPVIATNVGGNPEIVADDRTGQLVPRDDPGALADALCRYLDSPEILSTHGNSGRRAAQEKFSKEAMIRGYLAVYDAL